MGLVALVWSTGLLRAVTAEGGLLIGTFEYGHSNTLANVIESDDFTPINQRIDHFNSASQLLGFTLAEASTEALRVLVDLRGDNDGGGAAISGRVVFVAMPGTSATHATVTLAVNIEGRLEHNAGGSAGWNSIISFVGGTPPSSAGDTAGGTGLPGFKDVDEVHSLTRTVQLGVPVSFAVTLQAGVFAPHHPSHHGRADFANSLRFNPDAFFTIQTPGVTANSVDGDWLVNNQLSSAATAVPEPGSVTLLGAGVLALAGFCGWPRRKSVQRT
jgi:hypothetical protein